MTEEQGKTIVDAEGDVMRGLRKYYRPFVLYSQCKCNALVLLTGRGGRAHVQHHVAAARRNNAQHCQGHGHALVPHSTRRDSRHLSLQLPSHDSALGKEKDKLFLNV